MSTALHVLAFIVGLAVVVSILAGVGLWLLFPADDLDLGELDDRVEFERVMDRHIADRLAEWETHRDISRGNK
jgi:hypothetical protein